MTAALHIRAVSTIAAGWSGVNLADPAPATADPAWFDATAYLGRKGHRYLSTPTKYTMAAMQQSRAGFDGGQKAGVYIGSSSADTEHRRSIVQKLGQDADDLPGAASALSASLSAPAGCIAKRYAVHGPVVTVAGGDDTALVCLWSAAVAAARGEISSICIGQVEHQPDDDASDGAIIWLASTDTDQDALATLTINGWQRLNATGYGEVVRLAESLPAPVTILSARDTPANEEIAHTLSENHSGKPIQLISTNDIEDLTVKDLRPFSLLTLMILQNYEGSILVLSESGHLFNLTIAKMRTNHA
ncbi:MAG: hypothetical protein AAFQ51_04515 [Pseudomonadota bacterium]